MDQKELDNILKLHVEWLRDNTAGQRANLRGAYLENVNLRGANLENAYLENVNLRGANLENAYLENAYLGGANLENAYLENVNLRGANLGGANLENVNLRGANLGGANLGGANLREAYLGEAYLGGANLFGTDIFQFQAGKYYAFYHISSAYSDGNYLKIGCEGHSLSHWSEHGWEIGKKARFTQFEIDLHMLIIEQVITKIEVVT